MLSVDLQKKRIAPDDEAAQDGAGALTRRERENMNGENKTTIVNKTIKTGITFGSALAMVISYTTRSVGWAIFMGFELGVCGLFCSCATDAARQAGRETGKRKRRIV